MSQDNPTPKEQADTAVFADKRRLIVSKIENGYIVKSGPYQTYCMDLDAVLGFMKFHYGKLSEAKS